MRKLVLLLAVIAFSVVAKPVMAQYCNTNLYTSDNCTSSDYINSFSTTGGTTNISNLNSGCTALPGYTYYNNQTVTVLQGGTVNFTIENTPGFSEYYKIWVDYNNNGSFEDNEVVYNSGVKIAAGATATGSFIVPVSTATGVKRMRVRAVYSNNTFDGCSQETWGEVEDYNIQINPLPACSGTVTGGNATANPATVCSPTIQVLLDVTGGTAASGVTYQWQSSPNNTTWTDIPGATGATYTTGVATTTYFRRIITCTSSSSTANSASIQVVATPVLYATLPYTESFEASWINGCGTSDVPNNYWRNNPVSGDNSWRRNDDAASTNTAGWVNPNSGPYTPASSAGSFSARFHSYQAASGTKGSLDFFVNCNTPDLTKKLTFDFINTSGSDTLTILVSTNNGSTFTRLDSAGLASAWRTKTLFFNSTSATTVIRFTATSDFGVTDIGLDNVNIVGYPNCTGTPAGGNAVASPASVCSPTTPVGLSVTGSTAAGALTYQWQSSPNGTTWTDIPGATGDTYTATGISATTYFRRNTICAGSSSNAYSVSAQVTVTSPTYATLPFTESFEPSWINGCGTSDIPNNSWRNTPVTGNTSWRRNDDPAGPNTAAWVNPNSGPYTPASSAGSYSARFHSYQASSGTSGTLDLFLNCNTPDPVKKVSYDFINTSGTDSLSILVSTDNGVTFTRVDGATTATAWTTRTFTFTSTSATTVIRFKATSDFGVTDIGVDNVSVVGFPNCVANPTGGTTVSNPAAVCVGSSFSLSTTGSTTAAGITYQWQSSPDNTTWTNIAGATNSTVTIPQLTANTYYRLQLTCTLPGGGSATSTPAYVTFSAPTYATLPFTESFENTWINVCGVKDAPNNSWRNTPTGGNTSWRRNDDGGSAGWSSTNGAYTPAASLGTYSARFHSYDATSGTIGKFDLYLNCNTPPDATKKLSFDFINTSGNDSLTVYVSTDNGLTFSRLDSVKTSAVWRTKSITFSSLSAQTIVRFQATGDFGVTDIGLDNVKVVVFPNCAGTPTGGTAVSSKATVCLGETFDLSTTGETTAAGLTYQWQSSPDNTTWTNIAGATNPTLTTTQTASSYYRLVITCTNGGATGASSSVQVLSPALVSGTFTINSGAATGGTNFNNFNDAYNYIKCGINGPVIFNVNATSGPYNEQLIMNAVPGASATNTVTFNGNGRTITFNTSVQAQSAVIKLDGADYIRFNNLVIAPTGTSYGFGVQLINDADNNIINNCTININTTSTSTSFAGIVVSASQTSATGTGTTQCDNNTFSNNTITGGYYGITLVGSTTSANTSTQITGNTIKDFYSYGIYVYGSYSTIISGNTISRPARTSVTDFYGIYFTQVSASASITKNRITAPFGGAPTSTSTFYGIYFTAASSLSGLENIVSNNAIYGIVNSGSQYGLYNSSSSYAWYLHNTIALDDAASTATATYVTRGFYQTGQADGMAFMNNIVTIRRGGASAKHAIYLATTTSSIISNRNDYFVSASAGNNNVGYFNADRATLAAWQTATAGYDLNSISIDPLYTNPATGDLKPQNAGVNDRGQWVDVADDILGVARNTSTPDIGAWEFTPPPCIAPPTPGTATISVTPVCVNAPVVLGATGNSTGGTQTYQWQTSSTLAGTYTNIGSGGLGNPDTVIIASTTQYYRVAITCGASTVYSVPVLVTVTPALPAGTYTINKGAATTWTPGSNSGNFNSFNAANNAMSCGIAGSVIFNVVPGSGTAASPYYEQLILDSIPGTSPAATVTFNGNGNVIKYSSTSSTNRAVIKLVKTDYVTFDSLVIDAHGASGNYGFGVQLINNATFNTFRKCAILVNDSTTSTNYTGIAINFADAAATTSGLTQCHNNTFDRDSIVGGYYGVTVVGGSTAFINNNVFTRNVVRDFYLYGFYVSFTNNTLIEANDINRVGRKTNLSTFYGVYSTGNSTNLKISKNRIRNGFDGGPTSTSSFYGVYLTSTKASPGTATVISNNLIYNVNNSGDEYGFYNSASDYARYYHNTVSLDNTTSTATTTYTTRGFYQITAASGVEFKNNIISITRGGLSSKYALYFATALSDITSDRNDLYVNAAAGTANYTGYSGAARLTLADWQTASLQDANSKAVNPDYINPAGGDFTPGFTATAIDNIGAPVGITTDIKNAVRSTSTPDPGAYEFSIPNCTAPPTPGTSVANPNSNICMGSPIALNLTGNSVGAGQTYKWQTSPNQTGPWTDLSGVQTSPVYNTISTGTLWYRALVTCSGQTDSSVPVHVVLNPAFIGGVYTINPGNPTVWPSNNNFPSFNAAVAQLYCGITSSVIFNVAPGVYNEQVRIGRVPGVSSSVTVTFQSANGSAAGTVLSYGSTSSTANYTLKLDSTQYFIFKNLTIAAANSTNGRSIEFAGTASNDSILNSTITSPAVTTTSNANAVVYANGLRGSNIVMKGNTITGGATGVYIYGTSTTDRTSSHVLDGNTVSNFYNNGIYTYYTDRIKLNNNTLNIDGSQPLNTTAYGIYAGYSDTSYQVVGNTINVSNTAQAIYGIYVYYSNGTVTLPGKVANNSVNAVTNNSGTIYGLANYYSSNNNTVNNVVTLQTSGASSYGLYSYQDFNNNYYNNSINNTSTSTGNNYAAYFYHSSGANSNIKAMNNIFAHNGGGKAMYVYNPNFHYSDYNMLYTTGATLVQVGTPAGTFANLNAWQNAYIWDINSIVYKPAFVSNTDLHPDLAAPEVWAMHGRGKQLDDNNYDFNNATRPVTLTAGVPDLGAYEFLPTSTPIASTAIPATPAANSTQIFMLGTDTVMKINWGATVPPTIAVRRYSGVLPPNMASGSQYMYFYTDVQVPNPGSYTYGIKQYYIDPWQGFIPTERATRLGRTDAANNWQMNPTASSVDDIFNVLTENNLGYLGKFTGMTNGTVVIPTTNVYTGTDSSNKGTNFWVAYAYSYDFYGSGNTQNMVLYLSTDNQAANVTVKINGTPWARTYNIPANTAISTETLPKTGLFDARLTAEGKFTNGISIESDVPITAYAHIYYSTNSGATLLLPTGTYGYEYYTLNSKQYYSTAYSYNSFYVVASQDNTQVEITPANPTLNGRPANVPFQVTLNKGEVYQVLGALISGSEGYDLTGSRIKSVPNSAGKCLPMAVFAGSTRTGLGCGASLGSSGDILFQQVFPSQAWGMNYLTAPTSQGAAANQLQTNMFRVMVKDPTTVVKRNGVTLTPLISGRYYAYESNTADVITADKPVMVAQYQSSSGSCPNTSGDGDPELFYLSPVEQAIKSTGFYRNTLYAIDENYLTLVIPTGGLASLQIDGSNVFDYVYAHPNMPGYSVVVKRWGAGSGQSRVSSDSAFTGIVYGMGSVESYGYNVGTLVKNLLATSTITNTLASGGSSSSSFTCPNAPFTFSTLLAVKPTQLTWKISAIPQLSPNADVIQNNPTPTDSVLLNGRWFYKYTLSSSYTFSAVGTYQVPINFTHPSIDNCNNTAEALITVNVIAGPKSDYTVSYSGCLGDVAQFTGPTTSGTFTINRWQWNFGDATTSTIVNPTKTWAAPGTYNVSLRVISPEGCLGDTTKPITVNPLPIAAVSVDSFAICSGSTATFTATASAGSTYKWYTTATGGTALFTGQAFTTPVLTATGLSSSFVYYLEVTNSGGCISIRKRVVAQVYSKLATPVVVIDTVGAYKIRWKWNAVPGATGYEVSTNGTTWTPPSSGSTGLTHTILNLTPTTSYSLQVRALGVIACQTSTAAQKDTITLTDQIFIPNTFTPNGDGKNDMWKVYGNVIVSGSMAVFNQWGEKIFETANVTTGWDGRYKGKVQPVGVYIYVVKLTLENGSQVTKKGVINLVR